MNVLIYSGPEIYQESLNHTLTTLRSILLPQYSVQTISLQALNTQPWTVSCALLVLPQCHRSLNPTSGSSIKGYVETGGSFLCFGAGAICSSRDQKGASEISKDLILNFFDEPTGSYIYPTFRPADDTSRRVTLKSSEDQLLEGIIETRLGEFTGFEEKKSISILARYSEHITESSIAGIKCDIGLGRIAVWSPNLERSLGGEPDSTISTAFISKHANAGDRPLLDLLRSTLSCLSLPPPSEEKYIVSYPLPQFLTSSPAKPMILTKITDAIASPSPGSQLSVFKDDNDTFHFHHASEGNNLLKESRNTTKTNDSSQWQPKHVILCADTIPSQEQTPLFDLGLYYESLSGAQAKQKCPTAEDVWKLGEAFLYGEVVTSTQSMLDKNPRLLSRLPAPFVSLASYQLTGRGRGSNIWLSPLGCLQFSTLLRISLSSFPTNKLVFVQYLFALAVVEACRDENVLGKKGNDVRLKWPNDIYAIFEGGQKKIGGILVNTNFSGGQVDIVVGCGLNVLNVAPIFSLVQMLPREQQQTLSLEKTAATILAIFDKMWTTFTQERGSFDSFMDLYLERWLHSDQLVTLTTVSPPKRVRIVSITPEHGLLRTVPESPGEQGYIDLQPDGNSFDMLAGLIKSKP